MRVKHKEQRGPLKWIAHLEYLRNPLNRTIADQLLSFTPSITEEDDQPLMLNVQAAEFKPSCEPVKAIGLTKQKKQFGSIDSQLLQNLVQSTHKPKRQRRKANKHKKDEGKL